MILFNWWRKKNDKSIIQTYIQDRRSKDKSPSSSVMSRLFVHAEGRAVRTGGRLVIRYLQKMFAAHCQHRQKVFDEGRPFFFLSPFQFFKDDSTTTAGRKIFQLYQSSLMDWGTGGWQRRILMAFGKSNMSLTVMWIWGGIALVTMKAT